MNDGKICVSVCAGKTDEFIENIKRAEEFADVIELRFDCLEKIEPEKLWAEIKKIRQRFGGKLLATFRSFEQGGKRKLTFEEREDFWINSHVFEFVDWADLEQDFSVENINKFWGKAFSQVINSFHDFKNVPGNLNEIYNQISNNSDLVKIVAQANDITDSIPIWKLLDKAKKDNKQIIPIAMGESGKWTRILGLAHGAFMTYASFDSGSETAPGQVSARDLIEVYRAKELNEQTEIYGIIGNPVAQSLSPFMHNAAFKYHNLDAVYIPFEVKNLDEFITRMVNPASREIDLNFKGFSVTIPHKQTVIRHLDFVDEAAQRIGSVNTVKIIDGKLHGYNTDAKGFIEPLRNSFGDLKGAKVAVFGAGGSARAIIYTLKAEGADVTIFSRNPEKAKSLAEEFEVKLNELRIADYESRYAGFDILVNTTPLGMKGEFDTETPVAAGQLENARLVYDLVYNPLETPLIKEARKANVRAINGLEMLVAQGAEQFQIWSGKAAPMNEMSAAALGKL